jgi:hypothetical protein
VQPAWYLKQLLNALLAYQVGRAIDYHFQWGIDINGAVLMPANGQFKTKMDAAKMFAKAICYTSYIGNSSEFQVWMTKPREQETEKNFEQPSVANYSLDCELDRADYSGSEVREQLSSEQKIKLSEAAVERWYHTEESKDVKNVKGEKIASFVKLFARHLSLSTIQFIVRYYLEGKFTLDVLLNQLVEKDRVPPGIILPHQFPTDDDHFSDFDPTKLRGKLAELVGNRKLCAYADAVESLRSQVLSVPTAVPMPLVNLIGSYLPFIFE